MEFTLVTLLLPYQFDVVPSLGSAIINEKQWEVNDDEITQSVELWIKYRQVFIYLYVWSSTPAGVGFLFYPSMVDKINNKQVLR